MSSEILLDIKNQEKNNELDMKYREMCCTLCGHKLQYVRMYPATCGMCRESKLTGENELPMNYEALSDFRVLNSNNGRL